MHYTIYKTTNLINGKYYIGKHQTKNLNDGYIGSGKLLKRAIKKYGLNNFHKEILHICPTEKQMNILEKILVVSDGELNYNLCPGGHGGFGYINAVGKNIRSTQSIKIKNKISKTNKGRKLSAETKDRIGQSKIGNTNFTGKTHSVEWKQKHSKFMKRFTGKKNSQFGTCWITNGLENKKIKIIDLANFIEIGYYRGRINNALVAQR